MQSFTFRTTLTYQPHVSFIDKAVDFFNNASVFVFLLNTIFAILIAHLTESIQCWFPGTASDQPMHDNNDVYCPAAETYWYPADAKMIFVSEAHKEKHRMQYYEWTWVFMLVAAIVFIIPRLIQKLLIGSMIHFFCKQFKKTSGQQSVRTNGHISEMSDFLYSKFSNISTLERILLTMAYPCVKLVFLVTSIVQFGAVSAFIGQEMNIFWGWTLGTNLWHGITWKTTGMFPRQTFCDFLIPQKYGFNLQTVISCTLKANEHYEKMFLVIWFWLAILNVTTITAFLYSLIPFRKHYLLYKIFIKYQGNNMRSQSEIATFAYDYLTRDGEFAFSFTDSQHGVIAKELAEKLFKSYIVQRELR